MLLTPFRGKGKSKRAGEVAGSYKKVEAVVGGEARRGKDKPPVASSKRGKGYEKRFGARVTPDRGPEGWRDSILRARKKTSPGGNRGKTSRREGS